MRSFIEQVRKDVICYSIFLKIRNILRKYRSYFRIKLFIYIIRVNQIYSPLSAQSVVKSAHNWSLFVCIELGHLYTSAAVEIPSPSSNRLFILQNYTLWLRINDSFINKILLNKLSTRLISLNHDHFCIVQFRFEIRNDAMITQ